MKIISNNECYVQRVDLEYLLDNNVSIPKEVYNDYNRACLSNEDFIKIDNQISLRYILNSKIPSFEELNSLSTNNLEKMILKIRVIMLDSIGEEKTEDEIKEINEILLEKKNREYMINQIKEIINFQKKCSKLNYPTIPNPNKEVISNGELNAAVSLDKNKVVIYNLDGSRVEDPEDKEFCKVAFNILTRDENINKELDLDMKYDGNYFVIENKLNKKLKKLMNRARH